MTRPYTPASLAERWECSAEAKGDASGADRDT